jgi:uncharacterized protein (UPF0332 family)
MTFDWSQYLILAQDLAGQGTVSPSEEARLRDAISRAYYAAFCKARNHLRDKEHVSIPRRNVHAYVRGEFIKSSNKSREWIGESLRRMAIHRVNADYKDIMPGNLRKTTEFSLRMAKRILQKLKALPSK